MKAIVLYGLRESLRRKMFAVVLVLTAGFLALFAWGAHAAFRDTRGFVGPGDANLDPDVIAGAIVEGLAMFATLFLGAILSVFLTLNVVRGDAERGSCSHSSCVRSAAHGFCWRGSSVQPVSRRSTSSACTPPRSRS